jgi:hypothetical protein
LYAFCQFISVSGASGTSGSNPLSSSGESANHQFRCPARAYSTKNAMSRASAAHAGQINRRNAKVADEVRRDVADYAPAAMNEKKAALARPRGCQEERRAVAGAGLGTLAISAAM